jgi:hypothetical protein
MYIIWGVALALLVAAGLFSSLVAATGCARRPVGSTGQAGLSVLRKTVVMKNTAPRLWPQPDTVERHFELTFAPGADASADKAVRRYCGLTTIPGALQGFRGYYSPWDVLHFDFPYLDGTRHGIAKVYRRDGTLRSIICFHQGKKHGVHTFYGDPKGQTKVEEYYSHGQAVKSRAEIREPSWQEIVKENPWLQLPYHARTIRQHGAEQGSEK